MNPDAGQQVRQELWQLLMQHKVRLGFGVVCMLCFALFAVAPAKYLKDIVDALGSGKVPEVEQFFYVGIAFVGLFALKGASFFGQNYLMSSLGLLLVKDLRARLFENMIRQPLAFFNKKKGGELISNFTTDLNHLNDAITLAISGPLRDLPQIILLLALMLNRSWQLFLVTFALIPLAGLLIQKFGSKTKAVTSKRLQNYGDLTSFVNEVVQGIRVVKAFNMEAYELERFKKENRRLYNSFVKSIRIDSYSYPLIELLGGCFAAVILTYGGYLVINGQITGGDFASFIVSFFMLYDPIKKFNGFSLKVQEGMAAANRIFEILHTDMRIRDKEQAMVLPPLEKEIRIKVDRFCYADEVVLQDIDIVVPHGQVVALVGQSGSGKTTLVNLIPRFYEVPAADGYVSIDGIKVNDVTLKSLRSQIAVVTQEVVLFNDTIKANISYGNPACQDEQIIASAKAGHAHDFIMQLPNQYLEQVGEHGAALSGGQRQRISISRSLIKNARILILDEATSALDNESEQEVQKALVNLMQGRTTFVIAHRLSTVLHADVIYVLKAGRIIEQGTHQELLAQGGEYRRLYELQFQEAV